MMGTAQELRQAAETLRGWADKATPGPWVARLGGTHSWVALYDSEDKIPECESLPSFEQGGSATSYDATYIATMHPGVGLLVADLLDREADEWDVTGGCESGYGEAVRLARAINGGAA